MKCFFAFMGAVMVMLAGALFFPAVLPVMTIVFMCARMIWRPLDAFF